MLSQLANLFSGRSPDRREHERSRRAYKAAYTLDGTTWEPAIGVDIGEEGMNVLTQREIGDKPVNFRVTLDTKVVSMRCVSIWHSKTNYNGKQVDCYGLKFVGIAADDWDTIVKFIKGDSLEDSNKAQQDLESVRMKQDDVARMLPAAFQRRLFDELVKRKRLAPLEAEKEPLVAFEYGGVSPWRGKKMHRLTIHSKYNDGKNEDRFSTRFMFDDAGREIIVLN